MSDDRKISKILKVVDYYINNQIHLVSSRGNLNIDNRFSIEVHSKEGYEIRILLEIDNFIEISLTDRNYELTKEREHYFSANEIFLKFVYKCTQLLIDDRNTKPMERLEQELRKINIDKIIDDGPKSD